MSWLIVVSLVREMISGRSSLRSIRLSWASAFWGGTVMSRARPVFSVISPVMVPSSVLQEGGSQKFTSQNREALA